MGIVRRQSIVNSPFTKCLGVQQGEVYTAVGRHLESRAFYVLNESVSTFQIYRGIIFGSLVNSGELLEHGDHVLQAPMKCSCLGTSLVQFLDTLVAFLFLSWTPYGGDLKATRKTAVGAHISSLRDVPLLTLHAPPGSSPRFIRSWQPFCHVSDTEDPRKSASRQQTVADPVTTVLQGANLLP